MCKAAGTKARRRPEQGRARTAESLLIAPAPAAELGKVQPSSARRISLV